jgi:5-methylcytosine-specific restriction endonuclease McrA
VGSPRAKFGKNVQHHHMVKENLVTMEQPTEIQYAFIEANFTTREYTRLYYIEKEFAEKYCDTLPRGSIEEEFARRSIKIKMVRELSDFIRTYCRCPYCHEQVPQSLARCSCRKDAVTQQKSVKWPFPTPGINTEEHQESFLIDVEFPTEIYRTIFDPIVSKQIYAERIAAKTLNRNRKLLNAGRHTKQEINLLMLAQEKLCYYCTTPLVKEDGTPHFHIDHYVPVARDGRNDISNLVLSCPSCNISKGAEDGNYFIRFVSASLDLSTREKAKSIRHSVKVYRKKLKRLADVHNAQNSTKANKAAHSYKGYRVIKVII